MLTEREIEVLNLIGKSFTQKEIAKKLKITQPAVSNFYNRGIEKIKEAEETIKIKKELKIK
ncbi:Bacterial regulatory proteins, luxR family [uncultured archaeon]|nr:Bacterial regulatory proteins, luxR family [uncultured archaeon]